MSRRSSTDKSWYFYCAVSELIYRVSRRWNWLPLSCKPTITAPPFARTLSDSSSILQSPPPPKLGVIECSCLEKVCSSYVVGFTQTILLLYARTCLPQPQNVKLLPVSRSMIWMLGCWGKHRYSVSFGTWHTWVFISGNDLAHASDAGRKIFFRHQNSHMQTSLYCSWWERA